MNGFCFFFSSRRRHTRWNCDWSSDVCSSDLFMISISVPSLALSADVAMRRSADDRERFIYELSDQLRNIADPDRIMTRVAGAIGRYLAASRAGYSEIDESAHIIARAQWHAEHLSDVTGRFPLQAFGSVALDQLMRGETRVVDDT